jgi:hypothetical protein
MADACPILLDDRLKLLVQHEGRSLHVCASESRTYRVLAALPGVNFASFQPEQLRNLLCGMRGPDPITGSRQGLACAPAHIATLTEMKQMLHGGES